MAEETITPTDIKEAIRRQVILLKFSPVFMGSAYKNKVTENRIIEDDHNSHIDNAKIGCATGIGWCARLLAFSGRTSEQGILAEGRFS